ncbi:hypothetical protein TNIN_118731 [Trichonephila inaurata madagascariensis]|uniref:Uncharacterized protein n=1 Tax=Trichonephila inaurata madagascariensis TaxID=2747483 RepID=A0A8X6I946_9ARAC|nr:hypothetical protein TNIN_118731 [Trichonephila inaurata madagascariensis]
MRFTRRYLDYCHQEEHFPTSYVLFVDEAFFTQDCVQPPQSSFMGRRKTPWLLDIAFQCTVWSLLVVSISNICKLSRLFASAAAKLI